MGARAPEINCRRREKNSFPYLGNSKSIIYAVYMSNTSEGQEAFHIQGQCDALIRFFVFRGIYTRRNFSKLHA